MLHYTHQRAIVLDEAAIEGVRVCERNRLLSSPPNCSDLVAYLRHLGHADGLFSELREALLGREYPGVLCIFGDHVPIMLEVYRTLGAPDGMTDYLIWRSDQRRGAQENAMVADVSQLAERVIAQMSLR